MAVRILVVEDEALVARDICATLAELGYGTAEPCLSFEEGRQHFEARAYDMVLMDIHLGRGPDGIELAGWIRARSKVPIVYLTSHADKSTVQRAGATKPNGYLVKPFRRDALFACIETVLANAALEDSADDLGGLETGLTPGQLRKIRDVVESELAGDLSLERLSAVLGISRGHFTRIFKHSTGRTPYTFVLERRMERARQLLAQTDTPISGVAAEVGYESQGHFATLFKKVTGQTPRHYRRLHAKGPPEARGTPGQAPGSRTWGSHEGDATGSGDLG
ncbi:MAG: helix-turn-helix domain-containing protein [Myxococcota bacterium]